MIRLELTEAQAAQLVAAELGKAAFVMGYAQRHEWPNPEKWSLVVVFCDYPKAVKAGQAIGLLDRQRKLKPAKKSRPKTKRLHAMDDFAKSLGKSIDDRPAKKRAG